MKKGIRVIEFNYLLYSHQTVHQYLVVQLKYNDSVYLM
jgi:hypothetical protein